MSEIVSEMRLIAEARYRERNVTRHLGPGDIRPLSGRLADLIESQRQRIRELEEQIAERDSLIAKVKAAWFGPCAFDLKRDGASVSDALTASPKSVLAERDARVLEEAADDWGSQIRNGGAGSWLRERAAERRKGTGQ